MGMRVCQHQAGQFLMGLCKAGQFLMGLCKAIQQDYQHCPKAFMRLNTQGSVQMMEECSCS